ncbi:hypothetical protein [Saccharibacter floricola]|uniref:Uncharacterized protein n=1 Tax=Saccharibacter floricola DSM 15669 TaxID=1123227 RepID=A0ABQ0P1I3_9PROT|nr:hypothetical protein [Saccharibacter floricola]GBQ08812.1 hypothetical protein AA15669_1918 [Saccharibacter floricola DSM 15669]
MTSSSNSSLSELPSKEDETLSALNGKSYINTCKILDYLNGLKEQVGSLGGEVTHLATFGTELRTSANVANLSTGALQSWKTEMGGYFDPKLIFTLANNSLEDKKTKNTLINKLGVDKKHFKNNDVNEISQAIIRRLPEYYKEHKDNALNSFKDLGFDTYGYYRDIARSLSKLPKGELERTITSLNETQHRLQVDDIVLQHMQETDRTIHRTKAMIDTEKSKNGHKMLSKAEVYLQKEIRDKDNDVLNFDKETSSSGGYGYAILDLAARSIIPALSTIKDAVCNTPIKNKDDKKDRKDNNESSTLSKEKYKDKNLSSSTPTKRLVPNHDQHNSMLNGDTPSPPLQHVTPYHDDNNNIKRLWKLYTSTLLIYLPLITEETALPGGIVSPRNNKEKKGKKLSTPQDEQKNFPLPPPFLEGFTLELLSNSRKTKYHSRTNKDIDKIHPARSIISEKPRLISAYTNINEAQKTPQYIIDDRPIMLTVNNMTGQDLSHSLVASRTT